MRRTIERLSQQRKEKQDAFAKELEGLKKQSQKLSSSDNTIRLQHLLSRMQEIVSTKDISPDKIWQQVSHAFTEFQKTLDKNIEQTQDLFLSFASLIDASIALMDAKDKEWDALGSNHVGIIFKSIECLFFLFLH